jgi:hypothetical protein
LNVINGNQFFISVSNISGVLTTSNQTNKKIAGPLFWKYEDTSDGKLLVEIVLHNYFGRDLNMNINLKVVWVWRSRQGKVAADGWKSGLHPRTERERERTTQKNSRFIKSQDWFFHLEFIIISVRALHDFSFSFVNTYTHMVWNCKLTIAYSTKHMRKK